jgi:8-oxo-dGTP pyrophosphatase MutT (NUDIX family)
MIPGGGVEHGEHLAEMIVREFLEETGLTVTIGELLYVGSDRRTVPQVAAQRHSNIDSGRRRRPSAGGGVYPQIVDRAISPR